MRKLREALKRIDDREANHAREVQTLHTELKALQRENQILNETVVSYKQVMEATVDKHAAEIKQHKHDAISIEKIERITDAEHANEYKRLEGELSRTRSANTKLGKELHEALGEVAKLDSSEAKAKADRLAMLVGHAMAGFIIKSDAELSLQDLPTEAVGWAESVVAELERNRDDEAAP